MPYILSLDAKRVSGYGRNECCSNTGASHNSEHAIKLPDWLSVPSSSVMPIDLDQTIMFNSARSVRGEVLVLLRCGDYLEVSEKIRCTFTRPSSHVLQTVEWVMTIPERKTKRLEDLEVSPTQGAQYPQFWAMKFREKELSSRGEHAPCLTQSLSLQV